VEQHEEIEFKELTICILFWIVDRSTCSEAKVELILAEEEVFDHQINETFIGHLDIEARKPSCHDVVLRMQKEILRNR